MPTEIALHPREKISKRYNTQNNHPKAEVKSGNVTLVSMNGRKESVHVKVYNTSLEHFCVLYPQKKICKPLGVLNLKNTKLERLDNNDSFIVRQLGFDTPLSLTFVVENCRDLESWILAFTNRSSPTFSPLPIVEEDEEI